MAASATGKTEVAEYVLPKGVIFGDVAQPQQSIYEESATPNYLVGTELIYGDGRHYRYARAGATGLLQSLMQCGSTSRTEILAEDQTQTYPVIGDTTITVEIGTGLTLIELADELAGGVLTVNAGTGIGDDYYIVGSKVGTTDTNLSLVIDSPIRTTWTTSSNITIEESPWMNVIIGAEPTTAIAVGVPTIVVTANYYCWLQTKGLCSMLCDATETTLVGDLVGAPATQGTAGAVGLWVTLTQPWGIAMNANSTAGQAIVVYLTLN